MIEYADLFGESLAIGDANGAGRAELAIGAPAEDAGTLANAGSVTVLPGSSEGIAHVIKGLSTVTSTVFTPQSAGVPPKRARFGLSIERSRN